MAVAMQAIDDDVSFAIVVAFPSAGESFHERVSTSG
jgi:hypothetical protein